MVGQRATCGAATNARIDEQRECDRSVEKGGGCKWPGNGGWGECIGWVDRCGGRGGGAGASGVGVRVGVGSGWGHRLRSASVHFDGLIRRIR